MQPLSKRVSQKRNNEIYAYETDGKWEVSYTFTRCENNWTKTYAVEHCVQSSMQECMPEFDPPMEVYLPPPVCGC